MKKILDRKIIRLKGYDYRSCGAYFVTVCTKDRVHYFGEISDGKMHMNMLGEYCNQYLAGLAQQRISCCISAGIIMPNHIHVIAELQQFTQSMNQPYTDRRDALLGRTGSKTNEKNIPNKNVIDNHDMIVGHAKSAPLPRANYQGPTVGSIMNGIKGAITKFANQNNIPFKRQSRFHDNIIRDQGSYDRIQQYIKNNPKNWQEDRFR